ncbi:MAG: SLC13 family permease, partial [Endomicrobia bacterium]|nr:SLC13 family permease [Endomicrobiia bacterium]
MKTKFVVLFLLSLLAGILSQFLLGFTIQQSFIIAIFTTSIFGTLFFWEFRVGFVFIGSGIMLLIHAVDLEEFVKHASLDVVWFLVGMMIILAMLKEAGVFYYLTTKLLRLKNLTGEKLFLILTLLSWLLSGLMDEVTSIILVATVIFSLCDFLEVSPIPLLISSIMTTNIGSASTVLGNPIGVLIAIRGKLSFEDFIVYSLPVTIVCVVTTIIILRTIYKNYISQLTQKLKVHTESSEFIYLISTPMEKKTKISICLFILTVLLIAIHRRLELLLSLQENTVLVITPIIIAGIVLIVNHDKALKYIEHEVEWNSLLFFLFLFAQAGVLQSSGIAKKIAEIIVGMSNSTQTLLPLSDKLNLGLLFSSGFLSSILDNVVVVSSYIPVVFNLHRTISAETSTFWWAILFGGCFGGNITLIGSTANIIALGMLEKKYNTKIKFFDWIKVGIIVGLATMIISYLFLI